MTALRLAVFDCDGTLLDSQANIVRAMVECFASEGMSPPDARAVRRIVGLSLPQAMAALLPDADEDLHHRLADCYKRAFQRMRRDGELDHEPMFDGIGALLSRLSTAGWLLAVATGKSDRGLQIALGHHGITDHFISLQTADRHPSKPHPSMLLTAMADAGVKAADAVMIGDTHFDIHMGTAAGVRALGVSWGYHDGEELLAAGAAGVALDAGHLERLLHGA
ncbi:MAG: HAD-IA family hydrolase [Sphingomonadaceae bacterium]